MNGADTMSRNGTTGEKTGTDFKMVTFSLGGKDYGIDIMKVKEIVKYSDYTYVPNAAPFVRGVYNLRGEIISVIDLRIMFNLPAPQSSGEIQEGLILRLAGGDMGVIVDAIHGVVSVSSENFQPPHPLFGDVNIKHVSGVAENSGRLYILLDVEKIFSTEEVSRKPEPQVPTVDVARTKERAPAAEDGPETAFIEETLRTFRSFFVGPGNREWYRSRFLEWKAQRGEKDLQITSPAEADLFLASFYSTDSGRFWSRELADAFSGLLEKPAGKTVTVWNPGCGKGFETYSIAAALVEKFPDRGIKIWAHDIDLLAVSTAPNLVFPQADAPEYLRSHLVQGKNGYSFKSAIKDRIFFEYHNVLHDSVLPELDVVVARDLVSFLKDADRKKLIEEFHERLRPMGLLLLGTHERIDDPVRWKRVENKGVAAYKKIQPGVEGENEE